LAEIVWGEGPFSARLIIIGQNPGPEEMEQNRPFVGASGRILDHALQKVGIRRSDCFITNVCKHFIPPGQPVPPLLLSADRPMLDKELGMLHNAQVILTLGKEAFESLTWKDLQIRHNRKGAEKKKNAWLRGCPYQWGKYWIIPAVHPSFIMRTGFIESPLFEVDLDRARRFAFEAARPPEDHYHDNCTDQEIRDYVRLCVDRKECGLDIETPETTVDDDDLDPSIVSPIDLIGLSAEIGESVGVRQDQFDLLRPLFDDTSRYPVTVWGHNCGAFDFYHITKTLGFKFGGIKRADAMLGMHLLWSHLTNKDAATCFSIFTDIPYYKNTRKLDPHFYDTIGNCRDTYGALWAGRNILREMRKHPGMESLFWNHMMGAVDITNEWRVVGINTDQNRAGRDLLVCGLALQQYEEIWNKLMPFVSWSSPKQLIELFRKQGLPIFKRKRPGKNGGPPKFTETCDDDALEIYVKRFNSQIAKLVQEMRVLAHAADFLDVARADGHVSPRFKLAGQVGGRVQAVDPDLQNIPETIAGVFPRAIYIPDRPSEQVFGITDFSQIEYRLYVTQAKDQAGIDQINSGDYLYGFFYEDIFKEPFFLPNRPRSKSNIDPNVPPWKLLVAKSWPLGFIYGRGVPAATGLPITNRDCERIYSKFHQDHPRIQPFHTELLYTASRVGYLLSPFGRMRRFPNSKGQRNEILSFPGQVVAVDVLFRNALLPLPEILKERFGGRLLFSVHDSVGWCVRKEFAKQARETVDETMSAALAELGGLRIPVETKLGPNWGEAKRYEVYFGNTNSAPTTGTLPPNVESTSLGAGQ
jgi:DNA polymerase